MQVPGEIMEVDEILAAPIRGGNLGGDAVPSQPAVPISAVTRYNRRRKNISQQVARAVVDAAEWMIGCMPAALVVARRVHEVLVVSDDRVGYIRRYVEGQARQAARVAAVAVLAAALARHRVRGAYVGALVDGAAAAAAVATLSRFVRCVRIARIRAQGGNVNGLVANLEGGPLPGFGRSDFLMRIHGEMAPRLPSGTRFAIVGDDGEVLSCPAASLVPPPADAGSLPPGLPVAPAGGGGPPPAPAGGGSSPPAAPGPRGGFGSGAPSGSAFKRGPLLSFRFAWRDRLEDNERAAEGLAQFISVGTNGERDVPHVSGQGFLTRLLNRVAGRSHKSYHRASNKFHKRIVVLRELREEMIFTGVGHKRERTTLNLAAAEELARKVTSRAIEDGRIDGADSRWYKQGLVESFFIKDDDDAFWAGLAAAPVAIRA